MTDIFLFAKSAARATRFAEAGLIGCDMIEGSHVYVIYVQREQILSMIKDGKVKVFNSKKVRLIDVKTAEAELRV